MAKPKSGSGLYAYLDSRGVLSTGDEAQIQYAKWEYWAEYKKEWKKAKRKENKSFTIYLNPKEFKSVRKAAGTIGLSTTKFIAQAAIAASGKEQVFDPVLSGKIHEAMTLCCSQLDEALTTLPESISESVFNRLEQLENQILSLISHSNR